MAQRQKPILLYELLYGTIGVTLAAWALLTLPSTWHLKAAGLLVLVAILTPFSIRLQDPVRLPAAMPVEMAAMFLAPPQVSVLLAVWVGLVTSIRYRRPATRTLFNSGNLGLPNFLGVLALVVLAPRWPQPLSLPDHLPAVLLAIALRMLGNMLGSAGLFALEGKARYWPWVWNSLIEEVRTGGVSLRFLPLLMALAYPQAGLWSFLLGGLILASVGASMSRYQERIERQSLLDGLTGLGNRKAWEQFRIRQGTAQPGLVAVIDVDGLKEVNDTRGHDHGDAVLIDLARRLSAAAIEGTAFRIGGDEFTYCLTGAAANLSVVSALRRAAEEYSEHWKQQSYPVSASIGFAWSPDEAASISEAFALADRRMYEMKASRRTRAR